MGSVMNTVNYDVEGLRVIETSRLQFNGRYYGHLRDIASILDALVRHNVC